MNEEIKQALFRLMDRATNQREGADPYDERDSFAFGYYEGVEDALLSLGLYDEYNRKKGE